MIEDGKGSSVGESVGVISLVLAEFRPARETGEAQLDVRALGAQHAQSGNVLLTIVTKDVG